jgi:glycosyltransferase involved in cell wall biosynthesis
LYNPFDYYLLRHDLPSVFDIVDNWTSYPGMERAAAMLRDCQRLLCQECSALVTTTESLIPEGFDRSRATVIPNGVDMDLYPVSALAEPAETRNIPRPRAIYAGALWEWFDFDLLADVARRLSHLGIILIGFNKRPLPPLPENVFFLGPRKQQDLPYYFANADVGLIPFREDDLSTHVNPLKFYEYMAGGLPCVSVPMLPLSEFKREGILDFASGAEAFARSISMMIPWRHSRMDERRRIASEHDWKVLGLQFQNVLESLSPGPHNS